MDLMFVVDSSGSVREHQASNTTDNWNLTLQFVKDVVRTGTRVGHYYDRVALIVFSRLAELAFDFNRYSSQSDVLAAVERLRYHGSTTNTSLAIDLGRRVFRNASYGSRPNATHIMLLITDLYAEPDPGWRARFASSVALLNSTTNVKRFRKFFPANCQCCDPLAAVLVSCLALSICRLFIFWLARCKL